MNTSLLLLGAMAIACSSGNCTTVIQPGYVTPVIVEEPVVVVERHRPVIHGPLLIERRHVTPRPIVHHSVPGPRVTHSTPKHSAQQPRPSHSGRQGPKSGHSLGGHKK